MSLGGRTMLSEKNKSPYSLEEYIDKNMPRLIKENIKGDLGLNFHDIHVVMLTDFISKNLTEAGVEMASQKNEESYLQKLLDNKGKSFASGIKKEKADLFSDIKTVIIDSNLNEELSAKLINNIIED